MGGNVLPALLDRVQQWRDAFVLHVELVHNIVQGAATQQLHQIVLAAVAQYGPSLRFAARPCSNTDEQVP